VSFPAGTLTNHLRGAFGLIFRRMVCDPRCIGPEICARGCSCPYARLFAPKADSARPDGKQDRPRPFVLRAPVVDALHLAPGRAFTVDLHLFDFAQPNLRYFIWAFSELAKEGLGPTRTHVTLERVQRIQANGSPASVVFDSCGMRPDAEAEPLRLTLSPLRRKVDHLRLQFLTPTETTHRGMLLRTPYFPAIVARACDRIADLSRLYQGKELAIDLRELKERARSIDMVEVCVRETETLRRSRRTGIVYEIGGYLGYADFVGDLTEFVPWLRIAWWTGIGRQTVWGHGAVRALLPHDR